MKSARETISPQRYYARVIKRLRKRSPALGEPQVNARFGSNVNWFQAVQLARRTYGGIGFLTATFGYPVWRFFTIDTRPVGGEFKVIAPNQPRSLQPLRHDGRVKPFEMRVTVDGTARRCVICIGSSYICSNHGSTVLNWPALSSDLPPDPDRDAEFVAAHVNGIVDGALGLLVCITYREVGMGGPRKFWTDMNVINADSQDLRTIPSDTLEAIYYSWNGTNDGHVVPPRYEFMPMCC